MSVLRLLSPSRSTASGSQTKLPHASSSSKTDKIIIDIQLLTNGTILMEPPSDPLWPHARSAGPTDDQLLNGVLEIQVPKGSTRRRCKSVRVGARTRCRLNMGPGRGWEEDVIFERKVELCGDAEGIVLHEGMQRFEFTLIIPSTFAPHDWLPPNDVNGVIKPELFAELEGVPRARPSSPFGLFGLVSKRDKTGRSSRTPSRSPSPTSSRSLSPILRPADSLSFADTNPGGLPTVPSYDQSQVDELSRGIADPGTDDWIEGIHTSSRNIQVTHNPNPTGNFSDLDQRQSGFADGLGVWHLRVVTDVFTIGGPVHARLTLEAPSPRTTVFCWSLSLKQTHVITSPRDDPQHAQPITASKLVRMTIFGTKPARGSSHPGLGVPALWRGEEAGGQAQGRYMAEGNAFLPKHQEASPTTLPGISTPIQVSHALVCEVYFSVFGEDARGAPMAKGGPGELRVLQVVKPIILPSCSLIPARLDVPNYAQTMSDQPCPECGHRSNAHICLTCAPTFIPHPRHDPNEVPKPDEGFCMACYRRFTPLDPYQVETCACLLDVGDVEVRMARFWDKGERDDGGGAGPGVKIT